MFVYHGYDVKDVILSNETAEDVAKRNGITLTLIKEERVKVFYFDAKIYVSKYSYDSPSVGQAFCYAITENHGPDGYGVYMLTTKGDFDDMGDLYHSLMNYYDQQLKTFDNEYWRQNNEAQTLYIEYGEYDGIFCF